MRSAGATPFPEGLCQLPTPAQQQGMCGCVEQGQWPKHRSQHPRAELAELCAHTWSRRPPAGGSRNWFAWGLLRRVTVQNASLVGGGCKISRRAEFSCSRLGAAQATTFTSQNIGQDPEIRILSIMVLVHRSEMGPNSTDVDDAHLANSGANSTYVGRCCRVWGRFRAGLGLASVFNQARA